MTKFYLPAKYHNLEGLKNFKVTKQGSVKTIGYSSLRGLIQMLKRQNKSLKKLGCKVKFEFELPMKD